MAIAPRNIYPERVIEGDVDYPQGKARNLVNGEQGTGTPFDATWVNDLWGFNQALLAFAGITPNGQPDNVTTSQYLDALKIVNLRNLGYEPLGEWNTGVVITAANQYLIYNDKPYQPKVTTPLPYTTGAVPDLNDVEVISTLNQITKADIGLGNVDNTSDIDKPISTDVEAALRKIKILALAGL